MLYYKQTAFFVKAIKSIKVVTFCLAHSKMELMNLLLKRACMRSGNFNLIHVVLLYVIFRWKLFVSITVSIRYFNDFCFNPIFIATYWCFVVHSTLTVFFDRLKCILISIQCRTVYVYVILTFSHHFRE